MQSCRVLAAHFVVLLATTIAASAQTAPGNADNAPATSAPAATATQPNEPAASDSNTIHLHMPTAPVAQPEEQAPPARVVHHKKKRAAVAKIDTTAPDVTTTTPAPAAPTAPPPPANQVAKTPATAPAKDAKPTSGDLFPTTSVPFSFVPNTGPSSGAPKPKTTAPTMAKASPPPAQTIAPDVALNPGLVRQSQIIFAPGAPDPSTDALDAIRGLAGPLNTALAAGATGIQVIAYGGKRGDHSSDARRLSLKRALAVRKLLIEGGVPAGRIDVRAMGGANDGAAADRVDVFTKA